MSTITSGIAQGKAQSNGADQPTTEGADERAETLRKKSLIFLVTDNDEEELETENEGYERLEVAVGRPPYDAFFTFLPTVYKGTVFRTARKVYLIAPGLVRKIQKAASDLVKRMFFYVYLTHEGKVGVWAVNRESNDGFSSSARKSFKRWSDGERGWLSVQKTSDDSSYQFKRRPPQVVTWPTINGKAEDAETYINAAFEELTIDVLDHEAVVRFFDIED